MSIISLQICNFMWQNFILTKYIFCTEWQSSIGTNTLKYVQTCYLELMVQCDRDLLGQAIYETVCQRLTQTSRFMKQSDVISLGQATSVNWKWIQLHFQGEDSSCVHRLCGSDGIHSTHNTPSEPQGTARQSFLFTSAAQTKVGWYSRRRVEPSGKDKPFRWY